jgi:hypothetical protein
MLATNDQGYGRVTEITTDWLISLKVVLEKHKMGINDDS